MVLSVLLMGQRFLMSLTLSTDGCDHFRLSGLATVITSSIFLLVMMP